MVNSEGMVVYYQGREYMRFPFGNTFEFIPMEEYNASRPASTSSRSQAPSNNVSTRQSSAQTSEEDDDVVILRSQSVRASSSNVSQPQMDRKPIHDDSNPSIKAVPSSSTKRKYAETEDDAVYASDPQQPKRMKRMPRVRRHAKAPSTQRRNHTPHVLPYQHMYSSPQGQYALSVQQPHRPLSSAHVPEQQHQNPVHLAQQIQARHYHEPSVRTDGVQALRNFRQALPSAQMPDIPQEWLPQEPHPLLDAWLKLGGYGPQDQQDVQSTYPSHGTYNAQQAYGGQGMEFLERKNQPQLVSQPGYHEPTTAQIVQQNPAEQHQSSALTSNLPRDPNQPKVSTSDRQSTMIPTAMLRNWTTHPPEGVSDALKLLTAANHPHQLSAATTSDQSEHSNHGSRASRSKVSPDAKPQSSKTVKSQSNADEVQMISSKTAGKRKLSLEEDGLELTEALPKRRKSATQTRTPDSERPEPPQHVSSEPSNHKVTVHHTEEASNEHTPAEDPSSAEYAFDNFSPLLLARVGADELIEWFTAEELRCKYSSVELGQIFSDDHLTTLGMWDIMDPQLTGGQTTIPSDTARNNEFTSQQLTPPDSELEEIDRFLRVSIPGGGNSVDQGGDHEQSLHYEELQLSTLNQKAGDGFDSGEDGSAAGPLLPVSLKETVVRNTHEQNDASEGVSNKAKASEEAGQ